MVKTTSSTASSTPRRILFLGDFSYSSTKPIVSGAIRFLAEHPDVALHIHGAHPGDDDYEYGFDSEVDGVITCVGTHQRHIRRLAEAKGNRRFAFVCSPCDMPALKSRSISLVCDDAAIAGAAASLLVRHGLRTFGFVGARLDAERAGWDAARREAFLRTLASLGFQTDVYKSPPEKAGAVAELAALAAWLRALPKPCGLFVSYDQRAMRVLNICRAEGMAVPEQIQIVSADNEEWICESTLPTLTSIEPDFEGAGYRAAEALLAMMELNAQCTMHNAQCEPGPPEGTVETFGVRRVVERMSTTDAHGSLSRAVRARDYIRTHTGEPLSVAAVAKKLCCSTRMLQKSYKAVYGITVRDDIAEARLEKAKRLLAETKTPVGEIPELVGFESPLHFARHFKTHTGMSMRDWRRQHQASAAGTQAGFLRVASASSPGRGDPFPALRARRSSPAIP